VNVELSAYERRAYCGIYRSSFILELGRFFFLSIPGPLWNNRLYGLRILFACFVQEKDLLPFPGVKTKSVGFKTCSLVTIVIVLCQLPFLALLLFIQCNGCCMQFNIILCVGLQNCHRRRKYWSYRPQLPCGFHGKASDLYS